MDEYLVKLDGYEVDNLVGRALRKELDEVNQNIEVVKDVGKVYMAFYSSDPEVELAELKRDRKAILRVLAYYGVNTK